MTRGEQACGRCAHFAHKQVPSHGHAARLWLPGLVALGLSKLGAGQLNIPSCLISALHLPRKAGWLSDPSAAAAVMPACIARCEGRSYQICGCLLLSVCRALSRSASSQHAPARHSRGSQLWQLYKDVMTTVHNPSGYSRLVPVTARRGLRRSQQAELSDSLLPRPCQWAPVPAQQ